MNEQMPGQLWKVEEMQVLSIFTFAVALALALEAHLLG